MTQLQRKCYRSNAIPCVSSDVFSLSLIWTFVTIIGPSYPAGPLSGTVVSCGPVRPGGGAAVVPVSSVVSVSSSSSVVGVVVVVVVLVSFISVVGVVVVVVVLVALVVVVATAYGQVSSSPYNAVYDEIDEDQQPLLSLILDGLKNQTASKIAFYGTHEGSARMIMTYENNTRGINDPNDDTVIATPHNFTIENGYQYRNGKIFKPDGTELFAD